MLMGDVERGHDGNPFIADHLAAIADFLHFFIQQIDRSHQLALFAVGRRDAKLASHDIDGNALGIFRLTRGAHGRSSSVSGICASSASIRVFAWSSFSDKRLTSSALVATV